MDWLADGDRSEIAVERICAAAAESVAAHRLDGLNVDDIAERAGCSRATVYRHVGAKGAIRDGVLARSLGDRAAEVAIVRRYVAPAFS